MNKWVVLLIMCTGIILVLSFARVNSVTPIATITTTTTTTDFGNLGPPDCSRRGSFQSHHLHHTTTTTTTTTGCVVNHHPYRQVLPHLGSSPTRSPAGNRLFSEPPKYSDRRQNRCIAACSIIKCVSDNLIYFACCSPVFFVFLQVSNRSYWNN
jgi:hypothetical protein